MNKLFKKISIFVLTACMAVCAIAFVACEKEPAANGVTYTVTVTDAVGNPVKDVKVQWASYTAEKTDANGKATKVLEAGDYAISLSDLPTNYEYKTPVTATASNTSVNIQLTTDAYIVVVLDPDGKPVKGVKVGWCGTAEGATCSIGVASDDNGVVMRVQEAADYHVRLQNVPEGYTFQTSEENPEYYSELTTAEKRVMTIKLIKK